MNKLLVLIVGVVVLFVINSAYIVLQTDQALILQFGEPIKVEDKPGFHI